MLSLLSLSCELPCTMLHDFVSTAQASSQTPCFDKQFNPATLRREYKPGGKRARRIQRLPPNLTVLKKKILSKRFRRCCSHKCTRKVCTPDFAQAAAQWRKSWIMTPRKMKQNAFLIFMRQANPVKQFNEIGTCLKDGRRSLVLKSVQSMKSMKSEESAEKSMQSQQSEKSEPRYSFLSQPVCSRAWRFFTGIGKWTWSRVADMVKRGVQSYECKSSQRSAPRRKEMEHALWMVIQDLHHQSPYAKKNEPDKWQIPFHHKVCLWRLVEKLHASRQDDPSKPAVFTQGNPTFVTFRRVIISPA